MKPIFIILAESNAGPFIFIIILLVVAGIIGYLTAWFYAKSVYTPVIRSLEAEKAGLLKQVAGLKDDVESLNIKIEKNLEKISKLEEETAKLEAELVKKNIELDKRNTELISMRKALN